MSQYQTQYANFGYSPSGRGQTLVVDEEVVETTTYAQPSRRDNFLNAGYGNVRTQSNTFSVEPGRKTFDRNYVVEEEVVQPRSYGTVGGGYRPYQEYRSVKNAGTTTVVERVIEPSKSYVQQEIIETRDPYQQDYYQEPIRKEYVEASILDDRSRPVQVEEYRTPVVEQRVERYIEEPVVVPKQVIYEDGDFVDFNDEALLKLIRDDLARIDTRATYNAEPVYAIKEKEIPKYEDEEDAPGWFCGMCVAPRKKKEKRGTVLAPAPIQRVEKVETYVEQPIIYEREPEQNIEVIQGEPARVIGLRAAGDTEILEYNQKNYTTILEREGTTGRKSNYLPSQRVQSELVYEDTPLDRSGYSASNVRRYNN